MQQSINSREHALEHAYRSTGFPALDSLSRAGEAPDVVTSMIMYDTLTPFLHDQIAGRAVWRSSVKQMNLNYDSRVKRELSKDWEIFIGSTTGQFLMVVGKAPGSDTLLTRLPTVEEAETQLTILQEEYVGLPSSPAEITLLDALKAAKSYSLASHQVTAQYVLYSAKGSEPKPVWVIYMRSTSMICGNHL